jgi:hypothetical protein
MRTASIGRLVAATSFVVLAVLPPWWLWSSSKSHPHDADVTLAVRERPLVIDFFPIANPPLDDHQCRQAAEAVRPYFKNNKVPIMCVYHALRVWGKNAPFGDDAVRFEPRQGLVGRGLFTKILLDTATYRQYSAFTLDRLLLRSPYGVQVISTSDDGWGQEWGSTHIGKYIQVTGEMGIPASQVVHLDDGQPACVADIVRDEAMRLNSNVELEWVSIGLSLYLDQADWHNRFGQRVSFDDAARELIARPLGRGACLGAHVPFSLASLLASDRARPILSKKMQAAIIDRLGEYGRHLSRVQAADGSWGQDWALAQSLDSGQSALAGNESDRLTATGHHLEWMAICPPSIRPADDVLARAASYLVRNMSRTRAMIDEDFHAYPPATHAVRALLLLSGKRWTDPRWLSAGPS